MHPDLEPLAFLIGEWQGEGAGEYPTIESFSYAETVWFEPGPDKPWISYRQATKRIGGDGGPLHAEFGYFRALGGDRVELALAQPTGIVEVHRGVVDGQRITFTDGRVIGTESSVEVTRVERVLAVEGDVLSYELSMAAVGEPFQHHLAARLDRQSPGTE